jgi:hypothetical protein
VGNGGIREQPFPHPSSQSVIKQEKPTQIKALLLPLAEAANGNSRKIIHPNFYHIIVSLGISVTDGTCWGVWRAPHAKHPNGYL